MCLYLENSKTSVDRKKNTSEESVSINNEKVAIPYCDKRGVTKDKREVYNIIIVTVHRGGRKTVHWEESGLVISKNDIIDITTICYID